MNIKHTKKSTLHISLISFILFFASSTLYSDTLRLGLQMWPGDRVPAISRQLFLDDLVEDTSFGRYDLTPWEGTDSIQGFPFTIQYFKEMGAGKIFGGISLINYRTDYSFTGISPGNISFVKLKGYSAWDGEVELGYEYILEGKFTLAPKAGIRHHYQYYVYDEITIGTVSQITLNDKAGKGGLFRSSPYKANAQGGFLGANLAYKIIPNVSIIGELAMSSPILATIRGNFEGSTTNIGVINIGQGFGAAQLAYLDYNRARADYDINFLRWMIGLQFDVTGNFHLIGGYRQESLKESYPRYFNLKINTTTAFNNTLVNFNIFEYLTDKSFYENPESTEKGYIFFGATFDI